MKDWMKWALVAVLLAALVGGVILANKLTNKPVSGIETTAPSEEKSVFTEDDQILVQTTYEEYLAMTPEEQEAFKNAFSSLKAYTNWHYVAKETYNAKDVTIMGNDQTIDVSEIVGNNK